jgi:hypothetical protein
MFPVSRWTVARLFLGKYACPQCGLGSEDLIPTGLAEIVREFGSTVALKCQICGRTFIGKLDAQPSITETAPLPPVAAKQKDEAS